MGIVQGLTEFLPISSSGHLLLVPLLLGWDDAFITSLAFSVMLHLGTLAGPARLLPGGLAADRAGRVRDHPRSVVRRAIRTGAWPGCSWRRPSRRRSPGSSSTTPSRRSGSRGAGRRWRSRWSSAASSCGWPTGSVARTGASRTSRSRSRSASARPRRWPSSRASAGPGISISAARFAGLDRESAARFSFLMATPITAGAIVFEVRRLVVGRARRGRGARCPSWSGCSSSFAAGVFAISILLRYLRTHSLTIFVVYRFVLAGARPRRSSRRGDARHGGDEAGPPAGDPRPRRPAAHPDPAGAGGRPARARLPHDPGDDLARRGRARASSRSPATG